jgi:hypothetical protein
MPRLGPAALNIRMTHHDPPPRPARSGGGGLPIRILGAIGLAIGIVFAVTGLVMAGLAVFATVAMSSYGSNK